jgi:hypothetical protein
MVRNAPVPAKELPLRQLEGEPARRGIDQRFEALCQWWVYRRRSAGDTDINIGRQPGGAEPHVSLVALIWRLDRWEAFALVNNFQRRLRTLVKIGNLHGDSGPALAFDETHRNPCAACREREAQELNELLGFIWTRLGHGIDEILNPLIGYFDRLRQLAQVERARNDSLPMGSHVLVQSLELGHQFGSGQEAQLIRGLVQVDLPG